jgi:hypothetical protein
MELAPRMKFKIIVFFLVEMKYFSFIYLYMKLYFIIGLTIDVLFFVVNFKDSNKLTIVFLYLIN